MAGKPNDQDGLSGLLPGQTQASVTPVIVGVTPKLVVPNNPSRKTLLFVNTSPNLIWLSIIPGVSAANGILLAPSGGFMSTKDWEDYDFTRGPFFAIASALGSTLSVTEVQTF